MIELKKTQRSIVSMTFDGCVVKNYLGPFALERFENEVRVLQHLEKKSCPFVPTLVSFDRDRLKVRMTSCGVPVAQLSEDRCQSIFQELEAYGVVHEDKHRRNVTYRAQDGRFCVIDFEYSRILGREEMEAFTDRVDQLIDLIENELK